MNWYVKAIKGYIPLSRLDKQKLLDSAKKEIDWSSGFGEYYEERAKDELGEDAEQSAIDARVNEMVMDDLEEKYEERMWNMMHWVNKFPVWRALQVQREKTPQETIQNITLNPVGIYWSYDEQSADCHWGKYEGETVRVTLKARITPGIVDWRSTMRLQLDPSLGDEEKEVRLIEGARLIITEITVCDDTYRRSGQPMKVRLEAVA